MEPGRNPARIVVVDGREAVEIELQRGHRALIDADDWSAVAGYRWYLTRCGSNSYVQAKEPGTGKCVYLHRLVMCARPGQIIDHRDGMTVDCRRSELRATDSKGNNRNRAPVPGSSSRYKGVSYRPAWHARIKVDGRSIHLGSFESEEAAAVRYDEAAHEHFGDEARLNFFYTRPVRYA